jgi:hypothetical protein
MSPVTLKEPLAVLVQIQVLVLAPFTRKSSFQVDRRMVINIYSEPGCKTTSGSSVTFSKPGYGNLNTIGWNDSILSFKCAGN